MVENWTYETYRRIEDSVYQEIYAGSDNVYFRVGSDKKNYTVQYCAVQCKQSLYTRFVTQ